LPFGKRIDFDPQEVGGEACDLIRQAFAIIERYDPDLATEMGWLSPEVQLIRDPSADPDKSVSFSDNSVPGALYVSLRRGAGWVSPYDLADSLIHEHRHQKLYLLQAASPLIAIDAPLVQSPWREDRRPPSGLFHAVFVFYGLLNYWRFVASTADGPLAQYAAAEVGRIVDRLHSARATLFDTALTDCGRKLALAMYSGIDTVATEIPS
jgi:uncharacterized protein